VPVHDLDLGGRSGNDRVGLDLAHVIMTGQEYSRTCNDLTGCSDWSASGSEISNALRFALFFRLDDASLAASAKPLGYHTFMDEGIEHVEQGDVLFDSIRFELPKRLLITHLEDGGYCASMTTAVDVSGSRESFMVASGTRAAPPAGSPVEGACQKPTAPKGPVAPKRRLMRCSQAVETKSAESTRGLAEVRVDMGNVS